MTLVLLLSCHIMPKKFPMGEQHFPFLLCSKKPFPASHFCALSLMVEVARVLLRSVEVETEMKLRQSVLESQPVNNL